MRMYVDLTLPTDARVVARTRRVMSGYLEDMGVDNQDVHDVVLALDEACTNVIRHAFTTEHDFRLTAALGPDEVVVVVEDDGIGVPVDKIAGSPPDPWATSGRGLHIIRSLMTSVAVETVPQRQGTRVEMRKSLRSS